MAPAVASVEWVKEMGAMEDKDSATKETQDAAERGHAVDSDNGRVPFEFDRKAEARLRLKIDFYIIPTVALLYLFCFIDRANIGNAKLAGFEKDLNLKGSDYNAVLSIFYISYILFEIPCNIMCKWMGPGWFLPGTTFMFGVCSLACGFVTDFPTVSAVRFLLGIFEGALVIMIWIMAAERVTNAYMRVAAGLLPGIAYYLSRWYRRSELAFRLALYLTMAPLAGAFGGLLASGILTLDHVGSLQSWRMIFAIEGIITMGLGLLAFVTLTDRPHTARWLTQEEKDLAIARVMSERVGTTEVLDKIDVPKTRQGIVSPTTLATALIFLFNNITVQGLGFFAPTIITTIYPNSTVVIQQLYTVPPYIVGGFFTLVFPYLSWHWDHRMVFFIVCPPLVAIGYIMFLASPSAMVRYGATFLVTSGSFSLGAFCPANSSNNVVSDTARSSAIGTTVMVGNVGGLIATWSFLPFDAPDYPIGCGLNVGASAAMIICGASLWLFMIWDNRRREKVDISQALAGLSQKEIEDLDWHNPAFRWRP